MMSGVVDGDSDVAIAPGILDAVRFDNRTVDAGITKTATTADNSLLTISLWFKVSDDDGFQHSLVQMDDFNTYFFVNVFAQQDIIAAISGTSFEYLQFGTGATAYLNDVWNHLFLSCDTNHASGAKLKNIYLNNVNALYAPNDQDADVAFSIAFNSKPFGIPAASGNLGPGSQANSLISYAHVWIAPGVYLTSSDIIKFRTAGGAPEDLGSNGQTPTGSAPAYYFKGNSSTFSSNLGTGGAVTLTGSMQDVMGP